MNSPVFLLDITTSFKRGRDKKVRKRRLLSPAIVTTTATIGAAKGSNILSLLSKNKKFSKKGALLGLGTGLATGLITDQAYQNVARKSKAEFAEQRVGVKSYVRKGKLVRSYDRNQKKADTDKLIRNTTVVAGLLGLSTLSFLTLKGRYNKGIAESAKAALNKAKQIDVPNLKDSDLQRPNIHFTVGGLWYTPETRKSGQIASMVEGRFKGHTVPVDTSGYNVLGRNVPTNPIRIAVDMKYPSVRAFLQKGYNPSSRDLAAQAYAFHKKYPDQTIVLHGHSSGGFITNESMLILEKMGVDMNKFKQVTYGANNYGILPSSKNSMHIVDRNDWQAQPFNFPGATFVSEKKKKVGKTLGEKLIEDHGISHYMGSSEVRDKVKEFITPRDWKPPVVKVTPQKKPPSVKVSSSPIEEQKRLLSDARKQVREKSAKLRKLRGNTNIPAEKRAQAEEQSLKALRNSINEYRTRQRKSRQSS